MWTVSEFHRQLEQGALAGAREIKLVGALTEFPHALYQLADSLEVLDLSSTGLSSLPDDFARLHRLRVLFASHNRFTTLPSVLGQLPELEMLGFKACCIHTVPPESLPPRLRWLILTNNQITALPATLGERPRLQKLMLAGNQLESLPDSLVQCSRLELLRLAGNRLQTLPPPLLQLPRLVWLALAGNPLTQTSEQEMLTGTAKASIFSSDLEIHELLGRGASGHVYRATRRSDQQSLALKVFQQAHSSDGAPESELAAGLAAGQHPQLLTPLATVLPPLQGALTIALPLLPATMQPLAGPPSRRSCTRDVYAPGLQLSPAMAQHILAQISAAVRHLHLHGVLHGDLYAHNILWDPASGNALLGDFGAATLLSDLPSSQAHALMQLECRALDILRDELYAVAR